MRLASTLGLALSCAAVSFVACSDETSVSGGQGAAGEGGGAAGPMPGEAGAGSITEAGQPGAAGASSGAGAAQGGAPTQGGAAAQAGEATAAAGADSDGQAGAGPELPAPVLTDFFPTMGLPGETVTINGSDFAAAVEDNTVTIGGVAAEVQTVEPTIITVEIPAGAETGKISVTSRGHTLTSADDFEVLKDIPRQGLVASYPMSGNADDASGNDLDGTVSGAALVADRFGAASKAYSFDGVDDLISMGNPAALQLDTAITLAVWAKAAAHADGRTLISKVDDAKVAGYRFEMGSLGNGDKGYTVHIHSDGTGLNFARLSSDFVADAWTLLVFSLDGNSMRFDQGDGNFFEVQNHRALTSGALGDFKLGSSSPNSGYFAGVLDDVAVYDRKLSTAEISQLYEQTVSKR